MKPHLELARQLWRSHLQPGDLAIDATLGNGHDALFLHELGSEVIGLDIQLAALEKAKAQIGEKNVQLLHLSHAEIGSLCLPKPPKLIVYNLGYLPGGDKEITTLVESTLKSVEDSWKLLDLRGALSITCYPGHDEGFREEAALIEWASSLDSKRWHVCHHRWLNRVRAPSLLWIEARVHN
jgi:Putative rRNA methylase.